MFPGLFIHMNQFPDHRFYLRTDIGISKGTLIPGNRKAEPFGDLIHHRFLYLAEGSYNEHLSLEEALYRKHGGDIPPETDIYQGGFYNIIQMMTQGNLVYSKSLCFLKKDPLPVSGTKIAIKITLKGIIVHCSVYNIQRYIKFRKIFLKSGKFRLLKRILQPVDKTGGKVVGDW